LLKSAVRSPQSLVLVSRGWEQPQAQLYPFNLDEPIPEIPIPLRPGEEEPVLALGALLARVYDEARYDLRVDYKGEPDPPLDAATATWVHERLREAGHR